LNKPNDNLVSVSNDLSTSLKSYFYKIAYFLHVKPQAASNPEFRFAFYLYFLFFHMILAGEISLLRLSLPLSRLINSIDVRLLENSPLDLLPILHYAGGCSDMDSDNKEYPQVEPRSV